MFNVHLFIIQQQEIDPVWLLMTMQSLSPMLSIRCWLNNAALDNV